MRRGTMGVATVGVLSTLVGLGGSAAADGAERVSAAGPKAEAAGSNLVRRFGESNCKIGRYGSDPCGKSRYIIKPGKYVKVALQASGGKQIEFKLYRKGTEDQLGDTLNLEAGDRETIWRNREGSDVRVAFTADAEGLVNTVAKGKFLVGPF